MFKLITKSDISLLTIDCKIHAHQHNPKQSVHIGTCLCLPHADSQTVSSSHALLCIYTDAQMISK